MKEITNKILSLVLIVGLILGMTACSSSSSDDPYNDTLELFSAISRVEKFNSGGLNFTRDQAEQIIALIDPVLSGVIYTTALAEDINKKVNGILTKEQKALLNDMTASQGVPPEGAVPGSGAGGGGMGGGGLYDGTKYGGTGGTGIPQTGSSTVDYSINMFAKVEQLLIDNYLN